MSDDDIHDMMDRAHYAEIREARLRIELDRLKAESARLNGVVESLLTERRRTDGQRLKLMAENERLASECERLREALNELESWKIRHQDEVNARVEAENDLYAMQQERRREHSLRVKFAGEVESYRKLLVSVRALIGGAVPMVGNALDLIDAALSAGPLEKEHE